VIRSNLATRPFYNERAAHALIGLFALLVVFLTIFNVVRVVTLSSRNTSLSVDIRRDEQTAARLRQEASRIRGRINQQELEEVMAGAREANALIDRRTFSWTEFFNLIEKTMPENVMLTSVSPSVDKGRTIVQLTVLGRRAEDIDTLMEQLEGTGAFRSVQPMNEDVTEDGLHRMQLNADYVAPHTQTQKQTVSRLITKAPKATKAPKGSGNSFGVFETFGAFVMSRRPAASGLPGSRPSAPREDAQ
jgi:hypothetical protein